jgi:hypothetical protein
MVTKRGERGGEREKIAMRDERKYIKNMRCLKMRMSNRNIK